MLSFFEDPFQFIPMLLDSSINLVKIFFLQLQFLLLKNYNVTKIVYLGSFKYKDRGFPKHPLVCIYLYSIT